MSLALLLVVAALDAAGPADAPLLAETQGARSRSSFRVAPLQLSVTPFKPFQLVAPAPSPRARESTSPAPTQLTNPRTRVTCTLRVVRAGSAMDPGILGGMALATHDSERIVRNDVVPCAE